MITRHTEGVAVGERTGLLPHQIPTTQPSLAQHTLWVAQHRNAAAGVVRLPM